MDDTLRRTGEEWERGSGGMDVLINKSEWKDQSTNV